MKFKRALEGIKVADFSWAAAAPLATRYLADFGATVVRIESHRKPDTVRLGRPFKDNIPGINRSGFYTNFNSSKYGVSLDISMPKGQEVAKRFIKWADIVVESFTPGIAKKNGFDYETVRQFKPEIVYVSSSQHGQSGPYAKIPGYGFHAASAAGVFNFCGWPERPPVAAYGAYTDYTSPPITVVTIMAALDYRRRTGIGQYIDISQVETAIHQLAPAIMDYEVNGRIQGRSGNHLDYAAPHGAYRCKRKDEWCVIAIFTDREWRAFCETIGNPNWTYEERFNTLTGRKQHEDELDKLVESWTKNHEKEEIMTLMQKSGIRVGMVETVEDLFEDPQLKHRNHFRVLEHTAMGRCAYDAPPYRLSRTPDCQSAAPCLGEHNERVYKDFLGMSGDEIADLLIEGVITTDTDMTAFRSPY
ncbi:CaiB/BaiF CoA transferase family protein [Chloroflexota bacterium]